MKLGPAVGFESASDRRGYNGSNRDVEHGMGIVDVFDGEGGVEGARGVWADGAEDSTGGKRRDANGRARQPGAFPCMQKGKI